MAKYWADNKTFAATNHSLTDEVQNQNTMFWTCFLIPGAGLHVEPLGDSTDVYSRYVHQG
jgi:hypothetical protein